MTVNAALHNPKIYPLDVSLESYTRSTAFVLQDPKVAVSGLWMILRMSKGCVPRILDP
jgi:hypothetical protein